jgi:hypothetical protein
MEEGDNPPATTGDCHHVLHHSSSLYMLRSVQVTRLCRSCRSKSDFPHSAIGVEDKRQPIGLQDDLLKMEQATLDLSSTGLSFFCILKALRRRGRKTVECMYLMSRNPIEVFGNFKFVIRSCFPTASRVTFPLIISTRNMIPLAFSNCKVRYEKK